VHSINITHADVLKHPQNLGMIVHLNAFTKFCRFLWQTERMVYIEQSAIKSTKLCSIVPWTERNELYIFYYL